jgi:putative DNA primase/helicase
MVGWVCFWRASFSVRSPSVRLLNNVTFAGDMVRRGLRCNLEALDERPELRLFRRDALALARDDRPKYVAAALTVARAYLVAGAPQVCGPFGSYTDWSRMVRGPLVWLGEPDPILSLEDIREEDPELVAIREFFALWPIYLRLDMPYTTARVIEIACEQAPNSHDELWLKEFLLTISATRGREHEISAKSLGKWLQRISGRVVAGHRLIRGSAHAGASTWRLVKVPWGRSNGGFGLVWRVPASPLYVLRIAHFLYCIMRNLTWGRGSPLQSIPNPP